MGHNGGKKWGLPSPLSFDGAPLSFDGPPLLGENERNVPYSVLLQELNQAKKQLQELYNLESSEPDFSATETLKNLLKDRHLGSDDRKLDDRKCQEAGDFNEELRVAREAISSLRSMFRDHDPGHHILDTLENCVSIIVEKASHATGSAAHEEPEAEVAPPPTTKIIYFMPRSATPFMTTIARPVGQVTLRDFKAVFDRPGFYRYHSKNTDTEYGMVKEEIADDDRILPGNSGKIVLWVEEE